MKDLPSKEVEVLRFTRALFGLGPSPFLLAGVISRCHKELKKTAKDIFSEASSELHKWHSNVKEVEKPEEQTVLGDNQSYAKQQLGVKEGETKLLGLTWNKDYDKIQVTIPRETTSCTKRGILGKLARVYDPLGLVSPLTLTEKTLFRNACDLRIAWDEPLPSLLQHKWLKYEQNLVENVTVPRSLAKAEEPIESIDLPGFGDASGIGVSAAVYATVRQPSGVASGLMTAKSRLAKKGLTIPRLELVSGHMVTNLLHNVKESLRQFPVQSVVGWLESTVALHWIRGNGDYKQFVGNRVQKIQEKSYIEWRHVTPVDNPADLGSRGGTVSKSANLWWSGPEWLIHEERWPPNITTSDTNETRAEIKAEKHDFWKTIRITAQMIRFKTNARKGPENKVTGPLTTQETSKKESFGYEESKHETRTLKSSQRVNSNYTLKRMAKGFMNVVAEFKEIIQFMLITSH